jgi:PAS domain S-box-containing protein
MAEAKVPAEDAGLSDASAGNSHPAASFAACIRDAPESHVAARGAADLRRSTEESYRLLVEAVQDYAILLLDTEGRIASWNEGAQRIKGWTGEEVLGRSFEVFYPPEVVASGFPKRELEQAERDGRFEDEGWRVRKDGSCFWANVVITALRGPDGGLVGFGKVTRDLTARREAETQARQLAAKEAAHAEAVRRADELAAALDEANLEREAADRAAAAATEAYRELDQFAYVASHDLKAPLRGVANLAQWIEEDAGERLDAESIRHIRMLMGRVHRLEGLIDGILAYSRAGRTPRAAETVDSGNLVRSVVDLLAMPPGVEVEVAPEMPVLEAERLLLEQVFMNLIGNAVKHGGGGRTELTVRVAGHDVGEAVEFSVSDDGPGIAPEYHERIWGIFQTLASRDQVEGTGVGLALVKKIVERRGGRVSVESEPGSGATFRFLWPKHVSNGAPA